MKLLRPKLLALAVAILATFFPACRAHKPPEARLKLPEEVSWDLKMEIEDLETLNRIGLKPAQAAQIRDAVAGHDQYRQAQAAADQAYTDMIALLEKKRAAVARDEAPPPVLLEQIAAQEKKIGQCGEAVSSAAADLGAAIRAVLSREQVQIATMAAGAHVQAEEVLQGYRSLPDESFDREIGAYAREMASGEGGMTAEQIEGLFRDIRSLSEQEFRRDHDRLLNQVVLLYAPTGPEADPHLAYLFTKPTVAQAVTARAGVGK